MPGHDPEWWTRVDGSQLLEVRVAKNIEGFHLQEVRVPTRVEGIVGEALRAHT